MDCLPETLDPDIDAGPVQRCTAGICMTMGFEDMLPDLMKQGGFIEKVMSQMQGKADRIRRVFRVSPARTHVIPNSVFVVRASVCCWAWNGYR